MEANVIKLSDHRIELTHDGKVSIAAADHRFSTAWKNETILWSQLIKRCSKPVVTAETQDEYAAMQKGQQDNIKDIGGFVAGELKDGRRKAENVVSRSIVTLDADYPGPDFIEDLRMFAGYAWCIYSTHKHRPESPRLRLLIPLDRSVTAEEYEAIARKVAEDIGIDAFDDTTYQPSRLMYWPSVSADGKFVFEYEDQPFLCADAVLDLYPDWTDISYWPESKRAKKQRFRKAARQKDPLEKKGVIGAFNRTYTIPDAIGTFLPDVYEPTHSPDRYTYIEGSTAAGLVLYEDKFAYSNHATDPASGQLCNAFDLVRIHRFGALDTDPAKSGTSLESYQAMLDFAADDPATKATLLKERERDAAEDYAQPVTDGGDEDDADSAWKTALTVNKKTGAVENTLINLDLIFKNDPVFRGIRYNEFADAIAVTEDLPWRKKDGGYWRDADDAQVEMYLARNYGEFSKNKILTAFSKAVDNRSFHPVKEYLESLPDWDGIPRVDTLLVKYFHAEDTPYTRAVTRKTLCAAVCRVYEPGCKFDYMLVLVGPQGLKKSTFIAKLAVDWFSDNLSLSDTRDKTGAEKLQGNWILEIAELQGLKKMDMETLKAFITRQNDKFRAAYGRRVEPHPRQCVFIGTANAESGFLRDPTGGRRYWPVRTPCPATQDLTEDEIAQIWAEVLTYVAAGELLYLPPDLENVAKEKQREAIEEDPREGSIRLYLAMKLPVDWEKKDLFERRDWLDDHPMEEEVMERRYVCLREIWAECLGFNPSRMERRDSMVLANVMERIGGWKRSGSHRFGFYGVQLGWERQTDKLTNWMV